ncbi:MAG: hypothetical protein IMX01_06925 [Limnochordaceae bacterium]|nr:hypothetical protein [Limnochordaceae bacterium]
MRKGVWLHSLLFLMSVLVCAGRTVSASGGSSAPSANGLVFFLQPLWLATGGAPGEYDTEGTTLGQPAILLVLAGPQTQLQFSATPVAEVGGQARYSIQSATPPSLDIRYRVVRLLTWPGYSEPGPNTAYPGGSEEVLRALVQSRGGATAGGVASPLGQGGSLGEFWPAGPHQTAKDLTLNNLQFAILAIHARLSIRGVADQPAGTYQGEITVIVSAPES